MSIKMIFRIILLVEIASLSANFTTFRQIYRITGKEEVYIHSSLIITYCTQPTDEESLAVEEISAIPNKSSADFRFLVKLEGKKFVACTGRHIPFQKATLYQTNLSKIMLDDTEIPMSSNEIVNDDVRYYIDNKPKPYRFMKYHDAFYKALEDVNDVGEYDIGKYGWLKVDMAKTNEKIEFGKYIKLTLYDNGTLKDFEFDAAGYWDAGEPKPHRREPLEDNVEIKEVGETLELSWKIKGYPVSRPSPSITHEDSASSKPYTSTHVRSITTSTATIKPTVANFPESKSLWNRWDTETKIIVLGLSMLCFVLSYVLLFDKCRKMKSWSPQTKTQMPWATSLLKNKHVTKLATRFLRQKIKEQPSETQV